MNFTSLTARDASFVQLQVLKDFAEKNGQGSSFIGNRFFLAYANGVLLCLFSYDVGEHYIEIYDLCVLGSERRKGIATRCLQRFLWTHQSRHHVWVGVLDRRLIQLYQKLGFVELGIQTRSPLGRQFPFQFTGMLLSAPL